MERELKPHTERKLAIIDELAELADTIKETKEEQKCEKEDGIVQWNRKIKKENAMDEIKNIEAENKSIKE